MGKNNKKAIVIGASSGIGRAVAKALGADGYQVGLVARRSELLYQLQREIAFHTYIKQIDIARAEQAAVLLQELINEMNGMDLIVLNSGINTHNLSLELKGEIDTINVNVAGFVACANVACKHFLAQGSGHIVGISSIAALRGSAGSPAYSASKAFVSNYLEGLRHRLNRDNIHVTDIRPGLVDTAMIRGQAGLFWVATPEKAAQQILRAIKAKKRIAYVTKRWRLIAWIMKILPEKIYDLRFSLKIACLEREQPKGKDNVA